MKGLLYSDYQITRKFYIMGFLYCGMFALMSVLVRLSMLYGNIAHNSETLTSMQNDFPLIRYFVCLIFLLTFGAEGETVFADKNTGWLRFCQTTAVTDKQMVAEKFCFRFITVIVAYLIDLCYLILLSVVSGDMMYRNLFKNVTMICGMVLIGAFFDMTLRFILKNKPSVTLLEIGVIGILGIAVVPYMMNKMKKMGMTDEVAVGDLLPIELFTQIKPYLLFIVFVGIIIVAVAGFLVSVRAMQRREN